MPEIVQLLTLRVPVFAMPPPIPKDPFAMVRPEMLTVPPVTLNTGPPPLGAARVEDGAPRMRAAPYDGRRLEAPPVAKGPYIEIGKVIGRRCK